MLFADKVCMNASASSTEETTVTVLVENRGDRPLQVGSHFHFFEVNPALFFERWKAYGKRLNIAPGTAVRFEPGQRKTVALVPLVGDREVYGVSAADRAVRSE